MSQTFFISDLHLGHEKVIKFDDRPFKTLEEMDYTLIKNWNDTVGDDDTIYVLGDLSWYNAEDTYNILKRLKGNKILIKGNHDYFAKSAKCRSQFLEVTDYKEIKMGDTHIVLSHYPIMMWNWQYYHSILLYGHVHNSQDYDLICDYIEIARQTYNNPCKMRNVGCMMPYMNYTPQTLETIMNPNI